MKNRARFLVIILFVLISINGYSQLGKKLTLGVYAGLVKGMGKETVTQTGQSQNIFGSFGVGGLGGLNMMYSTSKRIEFGLDIHGVSVSKTSAALGLLSVGPQVQLNILPSDQRIIPYVSGSLNISFAALNQHANNSTIYPPSSYSNGNSADASVVSIQNQTSAAKLGLNGILGYRFNAGVNVKIKNGLWGFAEGGYNCLLVNGNSTLKNDFPESKGDFSYLNISIGVKINLLKSTRLY